MCLADDAARRRWFVSVPGEKKPKLFHSYTLFGLVPPSPLAGEKKFEPKKCSASSSRENAPVRNSTDERFDALVMLPLGFSLPRLGFPSRTTIRNGLSDLFLFTRDKSTAIYKYQAVNQRSHKENIKGRRARRCSVGVGCPALAHAGFLQRAHASRPPHECLHSVTMLRENQYTSSICVTAQRPPGRSPDWVRVTSNFRKASAIKAPGFISIRKVSLIHARRSPN